jgi:hypothetical protein
MSKFKRAGWPTVTPRILAPDVAGWGNTWQIATYRGN